MESLHKLLMFRKVLKIFFVIVAMWIVSLLTILKEYRRTGVVLADNENAYKEAFAKFRKEFGTNVGSAFEVWDLLPRANGSVTEEEKISLIKGYEYPPGAYGRPVYLESSMRYELKELVQAGWREHAFNEFVSDLIPANRSLPDPRDKWCKKQNYSAVLPSVTVVICFFNEAWSTLIRTVTSVLNRSPPHLLDQVILVDDNSSFPKLKKPLDDYVFSTPKVSLIRAPKRLGIIGARLLPIPQVKSPVIIYLDSHCECGEGWLEPLLQRISEDPNKVVSPVIDHIHEATFEYIVQDTHELRLGGFTWDLRFAWIGIPQGIRIKRKHPSAPIKTPTIAGGLFAISKAFFEKTGYYDRGMEIWGAENLELSFKTWMCGGSMEIVPCSHVGHIFRKRIPYEERKRSLRKNYVRLATVWLDDYAKYYYERIGNKKGEYGNVSERIELRKKLNCKPFHWYLENVYPQLELPDKYAATGQIYSANDYGLCLDAAISVSNYENSVNLITCHFQGGNQFWYYSRTGEIRRDNICLDYLYNSITLFFCNNAATQVWLYFEEEQVIRHMVTEQCLNIARFIEGYQVVLTNCVGSRTQKWVMENFKRERLAPQMQIGMSDVNKAYLKYEKKQFNETISNFKMDGKMFHP